MFFFDVLKTLLSYLWSLHFYHIFEVYKCGRFWIDGIWKKFFLEETSLIFFQFGGYVTPFNLEDMWLLSIWKRCSYASFFKFGRFAYACFLQFETSWIVSVLMVILFWRCLMIFEWPWKLWIVLIEKFLLICMICIYQLNCFQLKRFWIVCIMYMLWSMW